MVHVRGWHVLKLSDICCGNQGCQSKKKITKSLEVLKAPSYEILGA